MKALTEPQPRASLVTTGVVTVLTRPRPTSYRDRIAIHAGWEHDGYEGLPIGWRSTVNYRTAPNPPDRIVAAGVEIELPLPLGAVVGSAVLTDCVPIASLDDWQSGRIADPCHVVVDTSGPPYNGSLRIIRSEAHGTGLTSWTTPIEDQAPFGDFTPGRWALLLADAKPTTERCPWCWGTTTRGVAKPSHTEWHPCPACDGSGLCDPVPARGHSGLWEWAPAVVWVAGWVR